MYVPRPFASPDDEATLSLIDENGFGQLVANGAEGLIAAHVPMQLDRERRVLIGHLAGPNPLVEALDACEKSGAQVLAIFAGPHGYVSPSWYVPNNKSVPTWNYTAAHVYGTPRMIHAKPDLHALLEKLVAQYERLGWRMEDQDPVFMDKMLGGIAGFEIPLARIVGKFKLSQNRQAADRDGVIAGLEKSGGPGDAALAAAMRAHKK